MPQVLEAPEVQIEARRPIAIDDGYVSVSRYEHALPAAPQPRQPRSLRHAVMSMFKRTEPGEMPGCMISTERHEAALDRICRVDPYLFIRALSS